MADGFAEQFDGAEVIAPQPIPIKGGIADGEEYPIAALSTGVQAIVAAIVDIAQVPAALAAQSVLAAAALTAQSDINVRLITRQVVPTSLFLFSVASSGDRKTTSDRFAVTPIKDYERHIAAQYEIDRQDFNIADAAQKAAMRKAQNGTNKSRADIEAGLRDAGKPPVAPPLPILIVDEPTAQGLQRLFAEAQPSLGLFSDEGASWLGGYSMQDEQQAATGAMLSKLWDGEAIKRVRASKDEVVQILHGRRLSLHLMVQPGVAGKLFGSAELRDQGMLSRMLVAQPKSLKGQRLWREPLPESFDAIEAYAAKMGRRLAKALRFKEGTNRELDLSVVELQPETRAELIAFSDHCETAMRPGGVYEDIQDFAAKMPENAARIAAVLAHFEGADTLKRDGLSLNAIRAGIRIVQFYAGEAARLYGAGNTDDDADHAQMLIDFIRKRDLRLVGKQWLSQRAPKPCRPAKVLSRAIELLIEHNHLVPIKGGATVSHGTDAEKWYRDAYTVIAEEVSA